MEKNSIVIQLGVIASIITISTFLTGCWDLLDPPSPDIGYINIQSDPAGGSIYLDGNYKEITDIGQYITISTTTGSHDVEIYKVGYEKYSTSVSVYSGQSTTVNAYLNPISTLTPTPTPFEYAPLSAKIERIWFDHNVRKDDSEGMKIHIRFNVDNLKSMNCRAVAYFLTEDGIALNDYNDLYNTESKKVSSRKIFYPESNHFYYDDLSIFLPYDELHLTPGEHKLKFFIIIWYKNPELDRYINLDQSCFVSFTYTEF